MCTCTYTTRPSHAITDIYTGINTRRHIHAPPDNDASTQERCLSVTSARLNGDDINGSLRDTETETQAKRDTGTATATKRDRDRHIALFGLALTHKNWSENFTEILK